jgi:sigma-B regulation protein RsbU (phosphoserine phosphatase)
LLRGGGGETEILRSTGLPLGIMPDDMLRTLGKGYEAEPIRMRPDDRLALYSDGVPEAFDEQEQEWGEERLLECLRGASGEPAHVVVDHVLSEVDRFAGGAPQHDDITLLVFKRVS